MAEEDFLAEAMGLYMDATPEVVASGSGFARVMFAVSQGTSSSCCRRGAWKV